MQNVLVTGGLGFIGAHVVDELLAKGYDVVVYDRRVTERAPEARERVTYVQGDIRDAEAFAQALSNVASVVHLAAHVSVPGSMKTPHETFVHNVLGTETVFEAVRQAGNKRIVYASSAAVYGNNPKLPKEETDTLQPLSPYAASKEINERIAAVYERAYHTSSLGLRFFNVYGPEQKADHAYASVIPRWVEAAKAGKPLTVYGDGFQTRDFVHVRDLARAVVLALSASVTGICNIASGTEQSLKDVITCMAQVCGKELDVQYEDARPADIARSVASVDRALRTLAWKPEIEFAEGLKELLA